MIKRTSFYTSPFVFHRGISFRYGSHGYISCVFRCAYFLNFQTLLKTVGFVSLSIETSLTSQLVPMASVSLEIARSPHVYRGSDAVLVQYWLKFTSQSHCQCLHSWITIQPYLVRSRLCFAWLHICRSKLQYIVRHHLCIFMHALLWMIYACLCMHFYMHL